MKKTISFINIMALLVLTGCSIFSSANKKAEYPKSPEDVRRARVGSLTGEGGLIFGGKRDGAEESLGNAGIGINSYLWRASLDTLSFMPLSSADPFGGVIITDWYEDPEVKGERFKINVLILSKTISSDAIKITVFKQSGKSGSWRDTNVSEKVARDLENKILTRARELRIDKESH